MSKKQKPDLLAVLAIVVGLGVIGSSLAQGMFTSSAGQGQMAQAHPVINQTN